MIRRPAVAGRFYAADPAVLRRDLAALTEGSPPPGERARAIAIMVPHAGYMYSGRVAGATYGAVRLPERFVLLGPNHTGAGAAIAVVDEGSWDTPLGRAPIDTPLARDILGRCAAAEADDAAHGREHALEVQIPFLQHLRGTFRFVPICVGTLHTPLLLDLGRAVAEAARAAGDVLLVVSSDMSHYIPAADAERLDRMAIERVIDLDAEGLHRVVREGEISMCGVAPAVAGLRAARDLGARAGRLVAYATSGDVSGDRSSVVGYAGVAIT